MLKQHFGIAPSTARSKRGTVTSDANKQAAKWHAALPVEIWEYLQNERLLRNEDVADYQLGYVERADGRWITIPVTNRAGQVLFFKLRRAPSDQRKPKYIATTGSEAAIFNARVLKDKPEKLVICEGEFDCMVLHGLGIPAICSTAGAGTFKDEWIAQLDFVRDYYIVMDNDEAGRKGADELIKKLAAAYPNSSIMRVSLPPEVGDKGDITDYFKQQLGTADDLFGPTSKNVQLAAGAPPINVADFSEITLEDVARVLSLTIKQDYDNKLITFLAMLSAYTDDSQINVSFNSPSSTGKSYTAIQVASLFPAADKIELSGASPTSFFYGVGVYDKEREAKVVSLERKILLLYEQPNPLTQERLRPVLSHDERELNYRMTNKDQKGANRAELIIIRGFPATVFCSAGMRLDEQEATRAILLSSEVTEEKIREGVRLQALRSANGVEFDAQLEAQPERIALKNRILAIKREHVDDIIVPGPDEIVQRFSERFKKLKPRHMRDMGHLMKLIKAVALLNVWFRRQPDGTIIASQADIDQAFELWGRFIETQDWNVPPAVMEFYKACVLPAYRIKSEQHDYRDDIESGAIGITASELSDYSFRVHGIRPNNEVLRKQMLPQLESVGLITIGKPAKGKSDGRSRHIWPTWFPESKDPKNQNNVGTDGGVDTRNW